MAACVGIVTVLATRAAIMSIDARRLARKPQLTSWRPHQQTVAKHQVQHHRLRTSRQRQSCMHDVLAGTAHCARIDLLLQHLLGASMHLSATHAQSCRPFTTGLLHMRAGVHACRGGSTFEASAPKACRQAGKWTSVLRACQIHASIRKQADLQQGPEQREQATHSAPGRSPDADEDPHECASKLAG